MSEHVSMSKLLEIIGKINKNLPDKTYLAKDVKHILMQVVKEAENEQEPTRTN